MQKENENNENKPRQKCTKNHFVMLFPLESLFGDLKSQTLDSVNANNIYFFIYLEKERNAEKQTLQMQESLICNMHRKTDRLPLFT